MDRTYLQRVANNVLPRSKEKRDLTRALSEWEYRGNTYDLEEPVADCELCDHPDIRFQFEISNQYTGEELLIGSECIKRFNIAVMADGQRLDAHSASTKVNADRRKLIVEAKARRVFTTLVQLAGKEQSMDIENFAEYYSDRGAFTPNQLSWLLWKLDQHRVPFLKTDFKMIIRRGREQEQLLSMADWQMKRLWPCMSLSQQKWYRHQKSAPSN